MVVKSGVIINVIATTAMVGVAFTGVYLGINASTSSNNLEYIGATHHSGEENSDNYVFNYYFKLNKNYSDYVKDDFTFRVNSFAYNGEAYPSLEKILTNVRDCSNGVLGLDISLNISNINPEVKTSASFTITSSNNNHNWMESYTCDYSTNYLYDHKDGCVLDPYTDVYQLHIGPIIDTEADGRYSRESLTPINPHIYDKDGKEIEYDGFNVCYDDKEGGVYLYIDLADRHYQVGDVYFYTYNLTYKTYFEPSGSDHNETQMGFIYIIE